ncbi:histidinol-phosphate phosphatase family protein [Chthonomonas calidirosea]|uniref:D,D-heptose 1,7-bisphosphate phosphatase n=2 Tax=Chthonomonas TaxID=1077265 RepID=S0ESX0_CHTCT|nr:histidinol-phosphate phosphatase family domain/HAD-superfamily hydrolase, subfamily IIIA [Chthonomonas calidirosea T49]CEK14616.1 histidinol-phosphate phosphatase family protein [Chthonomonas calidirosea]
MHGVYFTLSQRTFVGMGAKESLESSVGSALFSKAQRYVRKKMVDRKSLYGGKIQEFIGCAVEERNVVIKRAVFLDRDGVLSVEGGDYVTRPELLRVLPRVGEAIGRLNRADFRVIIVTNQSAVGRGLMTVGDLEEVHARLRAEIASEGGRIDAVYFCPHRPEEGCSCRKPAPGMLLRAAEEYDIELPRSYMVGDSPKDIAAGAAVGSRTVLVLSGHTRAYEPSRFAAPQPECVCADLWNAVEWILSVEAADSGS